MKTKTQKERVLNIIKQSIEDKKAVRSFLKGEISFEILTEKGIKFANPL